MAKIIDTIKLFDSAPTPEIIAKNIENILQKKTPPSPNHSTYQRIYSLLDATSLQATDTREDIWKMVEEINHMEDNRPDITNIAAICTYPNFASTVKEALTSQTVKIATVVGAFPSSQTFLEVKVAETALAVADGAEEIDTVINLGLFFENNFDEVMEEITEIKHAAREATIKVILETGALKTPDNIQKAALIAMYAGADFIKSSTGKEYPGASLESTYLMCQAIKAFFAKTNHRVGIKISGGIRTYDDAMKHLTLVKHILGEEWITPQLFRIGTSSLHKQIGTML